MFKTENQSKTSHVVGATDGTQHTRKRGLRTLERTHSLRILRRSLLLSTLKRNLSLRTIKRTLKRTLKRNLYRTLLNIGTTMKDIVGVIEEVVENKNNIGGMVGEILVFE